MAAQETVTINIKAELRELRKNLGEIPGITAGEAKKMSIALEKELKKAAAAAKQTKVATTDAAGSLKKVAQGLGFGGAVNDLGDLTEGMGGLGVSAGAAGGALVGVGVALAALSGSIALAWELGEAISTAAMNADELAPKLEAISGMELVSSDSLQAAAAYEKQVGALSLVTSGFTQVLVDEYAPAMKRAAEVTTAVGLEAVEAYKSFQGWAATVRAMLPDVGGFVGEVTGATAAIDELAAQGEAARIKQEAYNRSVEAGKEATKKAADEGHAKYQKALADTEKAADKAADAEKKRAEAVAAMFAEAEARVAEEAFQQALADEAKAAADHAAVMQMFADAEAASAEARYQDEIRRTEELAQLREEGAATYAELQAGLFAEAMALVDQLAAQQQQKHEDELARIRDRMANTKQAMQEAIKNGNTERAEKLKQQLDADKDAADIQKAAAKRAYAVQKGIAITGILISGAQAVLSLLASPAIAALGPGAPAAAAGLAGATTALQVAAVAAAPPPKFHTGRSPDEMPATLTRQEAVLSPRAVAAVGGPSAVTALNRGTASAGAPTLYLSIDGKQADAIAMSAVKNGKGTRLALRSSRSEPVGAGHYGSR